MRVTHPFHPHRGQQVLYVAERYNRSGVRVLLKVDEETFCSVPPQWTDLVAPDPEVVMGKERAYFRVADLVALAGLMAGLRGRNSGDGR